MNPVTATATLVIGFYPGMECCEGCDLCVDDSAYRGRKRCFITKEIIHFPRQRGVRCPLEFEEENNGDQVSLPSR